MKRLNICMFTNLFYPINTGSSVFSYHLAKHLVRQGHQVVVITAQNESQPSYEELDGIIVYRLPCLTLPKLQLYFRFKWMTFTYTHKNVKFVEELFRKYQFDVIHQQNHIFDTILMSRRMKREFSVPICLTIHTYAKHTNPVFNAVLRVLDMVAKRVIADNSDVIVSPDYGVVAYVAERFKVDHSPYIPYGIEFEDCTPEDVDDFRRKFGVSKDAGNPVILSLGHVTSIRNRLDIVGAMPEILRHYPNAQLVIIGEEQTKEPRNLAESLGVSKQVIFTGALAHRAVTASFRVSTLEAHTFNLVPTAPGIASMEAMLAGLPVVTGRLDGKNQYEFLKDNENVLMVKIDDAADMARAVLHLLDDAAFRQMIAKNGQQVIAEQYSYDSVTKAYIRVYESICR